MRRVSRGLVYGGAAGAVLGLSKLHAATYGYDYSGSGRFGWSIVYIALLVLTAYGVGLPDLPRTRRGAWLAAAAAAVLSAAGVSVVQLFVGDALLPRFVVLGAAALATPWFVLCARLSGDGHARAEGRERVLVVAGRAECAALDDELAATPERPAVVVATVAPGEVAAARTPLLEERAAASRATLVALDRAALGDERVVGQVAGLHEAGLRVRTLSLFYEQWLGKLPLSELERVSLLFDIGELHRARYGRVKRLLDVAAAAAGAVVLVAILPLVLVGNRLGNPGPLLFRQQRVGKGGVVFEIVKLRTMRPAARGAVDAPDADQGEWTAAHDPRVTPFGRLLRRTHLDELPQTWNILRGDLSVVGPRPEQLRYVDELREKIPFYDLRHLVRPGLTGWAQVKYGYAGDERDAMEKLQYEFFYLRHQSLAFDARILARTVRSVIGRGGR